MKTGKTSKKHRKNRSRGGCQPKTRTVTRHPPIHPTWAGLINIQLFFILFPFLPFLIYFFVLSQKSYFKLFIISLNKQKSHLIFFHMELAHGRFRGDPICPRSRQQESFHIVFLQLQSPSRVRFLFSTCSCNPKPTTQTFLVFTKSSPLCPRNDFQMIGNDF